MVVEEYRTEEEQLEALGRWWKENGRSIVAAVVIALAASFGWQSWKSNDAQQLELASDNYQALLRAMSAQAESPSADITELAEQLKSEYSSSTYAQFAALHLAAIAVQDKNMPAAQEQLRWVLSHASNGSDTAQVAQLRLARVLAASGDIDQALSVLGEAGTGTYAATYAAAEGDILLAAGRDDEARDAYSKALALAGGESGRVNLPALQQKLESLVPVPARSIEIETSAEAVETAPAPKDIVDVPEE
jgi:predicted negative regulator of RcsB-dependent stress response